jgi:dTDP-4-dehydrorhamnose reductase
MRSLPECCAAAAQAVGARFVHVSTDFVFDGTLGRPLTESDPVRPLSVYGRTKEEGERRVRAAHPEALIVRTQWLYGPDGKHFVATMLRLAAEKKPLRVVDDQIGSPTSTVDVAAAIVRARARGRLRDGSLRVEGRGLLARIRGGRIPTRGGRLPGRTHPVERLSGAGAASRPQFLRKSHHGGHHRGRYAHVARRFGSIPCVVPDRPDMTSILVTGGAGFIGSNYVRGLLASRPDVSIVNVDTLTYSGNLENLEGVLDDRRHRFVRADIADAAGLSAALSGTDFEQVVHFAAESHVDRSIEDAGAFLRTNVLGTQVFDRSRPRASRHPLRSCFDG